MKPGRVKTRLGQIDTLVELLTREARLLRDVCEHEWVKATYGRTLCRGCGKAKTNETSDDQGQD